MVEVVDDAFKGNKRYVPLYFLETGVRPPQRFIVTEDGQFVKIDNTTELRAWVLDVADQIRTARRQVVEIIQVNQENHSVAFRKGH